MAGLIIPYRLPGDSSVRDYRLRRDHPELEKDATSGGLREINKYLSPPGRGNLVYFPPGVQPDVLTASLPVIITEGEFKTLALWRLANHETDRARFLPLGLSGVWNWRGTIGKTVGPDGSRRNIKGVIADFDRINWKRRCLIAYDADSAHKPNVKIAQSSLIRELWDRGAAVAALSWPEAQGKGADDFLASCGADAFLALISSARTQTGEWKSRLIRNAQGSPKALLANAALAPRYAPEWEGVLGYNEFSMTAVTLRRTPWGSAPHCDWTEHDDRLATEWLQRKLVWRGCGESKHKCEAEKRAPPDSVLH